MNLAQQQEEQQKQERIQKEDTTTYETFLQTLPQLHDELYLPQCIYVSNGGIGIDNGNDDEILICGSVDNKDCYSYHLKKKEYKVICSYPKKIKLNGHIVISYYSSSSSASSNDNNNNNNNKILNLISFGGNYDTGLYGTPYHTLRMNYKSIWKNDQIKNKWSSIPDTLIGEKQSMNLIGARAVINRSLENPLLFITYHPKNIAVIELNSLTYIENIKNNTLPVGKDISYHCFVRKETNGDINEFILMSGGETLLIRYDNIKKEFHYQTLSICSSFENFYKYAFTCWNYRIFIFGGFNWKQNKKMDTIWKFNMKDKDCIEWKECVAKMPVPTSGVTAILTDSDSSIHIIGGNNSGRHYATRVWTTKELKSIMRRWTRENDLKMGWISEFHDIISNYMTL